MVSKKKQNKFEKKTITLNIIFAIILSISLIFNILFGLGILPPKEEIITKMPVTSALYDIERINETEIYRLSVINNGSTFANRLRIQIGFPDNTTIIDLEFWPPQTWEWDESYGGIGDSHCHVIFNEVQVGEEVKVTLTLTNNVFQEDKILIIEPVYQNIWSREECKIEVKSS